MFFTQFAVLISYSIPDNYDDLIIDEHIIWIQEDDKSYYNPQEQFVSQDAKSALEAFKVLVADRHAGYQLEDLEIEYIDNSGNDVNI